MFWTIVGALLFVFVGIPLIIVAITVTFQLIKAICEVIIESINS